MNRPGPNEPTEWDAGEYHRVSAPQYSWGQRVLARLPLSGSETVVDAGCGSGRLTAELLERLPRGHVIAVDRSANMLQEARAYLEPRFPGRVTFIQADIGRLTLPEPVDAIFSTATFHWVPDHPRLFRSLFACLEPGGRLVAQCGGGPNIAVLKARAEALLDSPAYRADAMGWANPWQFASPQETAERLVAAGFTDVETSLVAEPTPFADAAAYARFIRSAVLVAHLEAIPSAATRDRFIAELTTLAASDDPPFTLDYWRLNISATRPPGIRA
jgi:trans-aconitate 2-methyltransferase